MAQLANDPLQNLAELNTAVVNTVQEGDGNCEHVVLTGLWKLWDPPQILEAPGLCQAMWVYFSWKPKCQLSAVLTSILHATSALRYLQ